MGTDAWEKWVISHSAITGLSSVKTVQEPGIGTLQWTNSCITISCAPGQPLDGLRSFQSMCFDNVSELLKSDLTSQNCLGTWNRRQAQSIWCINEWGASETHWIGRKTLAILCGIWPCRGVSIVYSHLLLSTQSNFVCVPALEILNASEGYLWVSLGIKICLSWLIQLSIGENPWIWTFLWAWFVVGCRSRSSGVLVEQTMWTWHIVYSSYLWRRLLEFESHKGVCRSI